MYKKICYLCLCLFMSTGIFAKKVTVTVIPSTAVIFHEGKAIEGNNGVYGIPVGFISKTYVAKCDGFDERAFVLDMKSLDAIEIKLTPNRKTVNIMFTPENAKLFVDGIPADNATFIIRKGENKNVKITADDYDTYSHNFSFAYFGDLTNSLNIDLVRNAQEVRIQYPVPADIWVNGVQIANSSTSATVTIHKREGNIPIKIHAPGYMDYIARINFLDGLQVYDYKDLVADEAFVNSIGGDEMAKIANSWQDLAAHNMTREDAIRRLANILRDYSEEALNIDMVAGTISTPWLQSKQFNSGIARTKIEIVETYNPLSNEVTFRYRIRSQFATKKNPSDEDFNKWDRVLKTYEDVPRRLSTAISNLLK